MFSPPFHSLDAFGDWNDRGGKDPEGVILGRALAAAGPRTAATRRAYCSCMVDQAMTSSKIQ